MYMLNTLLSVLDAALLVHAYDSAPNVPDGTNFIETKLFENVVSATRLQQSLSRAVEILLPACFRLDFWAETILGHDVVILVPVDQQVRKGSFQELGSLCWHCQYFETEPSPNICIFGQNGNVVIR